MLAADCKGLTQGLAYPLLASPKLDGIRAYTAPGGVYSRNQKLIPNKFIQAALELLPHGLDGELIVGEATDEGAFRATSSGVMRVNGEPKFTFWVFDFIEQTNPYEARLETLKSLLDLNWAVRVAPVKITPNLWCKSESELLLYESFIVGAGYEGVMLRDPLSMYKHGRSTLKEGALIKVKRFEDAEALVIGFKEYEHNDNPAVTDANGHAKRSSHKANKRGAGTLGALTCQLTNSDLTFDVGTGFTAAQRAELWAQRDTLIGQYCKYKFFSTGGKERPRFPVWKGFRPFDDM